MTSSTIKIFDPSSLPRVAIIVGYLHMFVSLGYLTFTVYGLIWPSPTFGGQYILEAVITIIFSSLLAFSSYLLTIGIQKRSHLMILPWLIIEGIDLIMDCVYKAISFDNVIWREDGVFRLCFALLGISIGLWFAVLSLYKIIRDEKTKIIQDDEEKVMWSS